MSIPELVHLLLHPNLLQEFYSKLGVNNESENINIYLKNELSIESEVFIFDEVAEYLEIYKNNVKYMFFFSMDDIKELLLDLGLLDKSYTELQIAERLLHYRIFDA